MTDIVIVVAVYLACVYLNDIIKLIKEKKKVSADIV